MSEKITPTQICVQARNILKPRARQSRLYLKESDGWKALMDSEAAIKIRQLYDPNVRNVISSGAIAEAIERLVQDPDLQIVFAEETEEHLIKVKNGVFNTLTGTLDEVAEQKEFACQYAFNYIEKDKRKATYFTHFTNSTFGEDYELKKKLLLQIFGYVISSHLKGKAGFFFIGESNSGKSTVLDLLVHVTPDQFVTAIPLYRLENRFNLAKLADSRINISTEISEKSFKAPDIFKMMTSNEVVTAEHKGKKPFEFRIRCKTINAGNVLPEMGNLEGHDALLNRMVILLFPISIPKEKQNLELSDKLRAEADSIFSDALDELHELQKNNFKFIEPKDTKKLKAQMASNGRAFDEFLEDCCVKDIDAKAHFSDLYKVYKIFCEENLYENVMSSTQFSQCISRLRGLTRSKFRINGGRPLYGVLGIRLKTYEEQLAQENENNESLNIQSKKTWNAGTVEQEANNEKNKC